MPKDTSQGRGAHGKARASYRVVEQDLTRLPLRDLCSAVCARNDSDVNVGVLIGIRLGKAFRKAGARKGAIRVNGTEHLNP
jgi:hypothetical protein